MIIFKCKMCGGDLHPAENVTTCECEYCGSVQTIPMADNEKKMNLFSRAQRLLRSCEFDKAAGVYESIVAEFPEEAEAYWGLVLCKYGIEYVDDPATGKKVPTCHRSSFDSVMEDSNFEQACENADAVARRVYRDETKAIEELRKGIIEVSGKEEPYDIFICYKETDENGDRTLDSVLAQDIYDTLTEKGYRVFFSRITLEDKLGQEYEPYIFAALNSAKIMLAVGTDYEYYNAVWVKNEWSRFLKLIASGEKKTLIPCYKGIDAYDMPKEFAKLQAQDMGKVDAMQDLVRGIEKIIVPKTENNTITAQQSGDPTINSLLERAKLFVEDGDYDNASKYYNKVLDIHPQSSDAYIGLLMVEYKLSRPLDLTECRQSLEENKNWQKALRFAQPHQARILDGYLNAHKIFMAYKKGIDLMFASCSIDSQLKANEEFGKCGEYKDAQVLAEVCKRAATNRERVKQELWKINKEQEVAQQEIERQNQAENELRKEISDLKMKCEENRQLIILKQADLENVSGLFAGKRKKVIEDEIEKLKHDELEKSIKIEECRKKLLSCGISSSLNMDVNEYTYRRATLLDEYGLVSAAYGLFSSITNFRDVNSILKSEVYVRVAENFERSVSIVKAPLPGKVTQLRVKVGDYVRRAEVLVAIEALKMENEIMAYDEGIILSVNVRKGDNVKEGSKLCVVCNIGSRKDETTSPDTASGLGVKDSLETIKAPFPCKITDIRVSAGDVVRKATVLCIAEAMMMQNDIMMPKDGKIHAVHITKGMTLKTGSIMFEIESAL